MNNILFQTKHFFVLPHEVNPRTTKGNINFRQQKMVKILLLCASDVLISKCCCTPLLHGHATESLIYLPTPYTYGAAFIEINYTCYKISSQRILRHINEIFVCKLFLSK